MSIGISGERDQESIRAFQDKLSDVPGIGKKKNPKKMHITLGVFNILQEEVDDAEMRFKRVGEKFTDLTSPGSFLMNLKGLEMGDGSQVLFMKVQLGKEILEILRGLLEDELGDKITDMRFSPHVTIFDECSLDPETRENLFKTTEVIVGPTLSACDMSFRERRQQGEQRGAGSVRVITYVF